jgi:xanthine/CO dehydrogenase XdhC/CoxF family maturation factor
VKAWQETSLLLTEAARLAAAGRSAAIATVVRISGSAYRRPGAKLLVADDGAMSGGVSGGCLELDVREVALEVIRGATPHLARYDTGSDENQVWGLGLGCNGMVEVFVDRVAALDPAVVRARDLLAADHAFAIAKVIGGAQPVGATIVIEGDGTRTGSSGDAAADRAIVAAARRRLNDHESGFVEVGTRQIFVDVLLPPPRLIICGAGDDAMPLARVASSAGFRVTVADHRAGYLTPDRFPTATLFDGRPEAGLAALAPAAHSFVVIQTHSLAHDRNWARSAVESPAGYVGLLGPRERGTQILQELPADARDRVFAPVGLDLAAEGPEQIAVSIVAELLAVRANRAPQHLRDRESAIHAG